MINTAILIDGGYYRKRSKALWGAKTARARAAELSAYCHDHIIKFEDEPRHLYRIFYYDCAPVRRTVYHPFLKKQIRLENNETFEWTESFFAELKQKRKFALRLGTLSTYDIGYNLKPEITKKLFSGAITVDQISERDFFFNAVQKGVDMRIGVDIASMTFKKQVQQIILVAGDSDFVPAAKMARREGIDFILDPMYQKIKDDLFEHIDGLRSPWKLKGK